MKKLLPFLVAAIAGVFFYGCGKNEPLQPSYGTDYGDLQYTIRGAHDTSVEQTGKVSMLLNIERSAGKFEDVSLSVKGLPEGMTAKFTPQSAIPTFNTLLILEATQVDAGDYTLQVVGASQTTGQKYFDFKITVKPYSNPALGLEGSFKEKRSCSQTGDSSHPVTIIPVEGVAGKVQIKGIWIGSAAYTVLADIDAANQSINVPMQSVHNVVFHGNGIYSKKTIELTYSVKDTSATHVVNDECTSLFTKQ